MIFIETRGTLTVFPYNLQSVFIVYVPTLGLLKMRTKSHYF